MPRTQRRTTAEETPLARYVREEIARSKAVCEEVVLRGHPEKEDLHELHRDVRRLRVLVRWWAQVGPVRSRETLRSLGNRLRRLSRLVGSVRDLDVQLQLWEKVRGSPRRVPRNVPPPLATFGQRLRDGARTGRELLRASLRAEVAAGLFRDLERNLRGVGSSASLSALEAALRRERRRLARMAAHARRRSLRAPDPERMHDLRIRVRQLRYLTDLEDSLAGERSSTFPTRYARLQRRLGELHDRDLLATHLTRVAPTHVVTPWGERLHREREGLRAELLEELEELRPRHHLGEPRARRPPAR